MKKSAWALIFGLLLGLGAVAQDDEDGVSAVQFVVLKDDNNKPVRNAGVVMHPVSKNGKQERGGLELKTDADGKASFDGVPYGRLRIQVLAQGFQTYGDDYQINRPAMEITVRLKRPQKQYSIYEEHPGDKDKKDDSKPQNPPAADPNAKPK
jgi:Carboxypeptidase regulatory-like domain